MPIREPVVLDGRTYDLRLIGPQALVWPSPPVAVPTFTVLGQSTMVARPLPMSNAPNSSDFVSGSWTGRLIDAGEMALTFPNKEASDGPPWRNRFSPAGHLEWVEIWFDEYLDAVCCIEKVDTKRDQIVISGHDGMFMGKKAYQRDWICVAAPRDVIDRGTRLWVPVVSDDFTAGALNPQWHDFSSGGSIGVGNSGGLQLTVPAVLNDTATVETNTFTLAAATSVWAANCDVQWDSLTGGNSFLFSVVESAGHAAAVALWQGFAQFYYDGTLIWQTQIGSAPSYSLLLESDGDSFWAFANGMFIGGGRRSQTTTTSLQITLKNQSGGAAGTISVSNVLVRVLQPFLMRGSDKGDYVLPGDATTYPSGGLHARYYNNADLQSDAHDLAKTHHPFRSFAYGGTNAVQYAEQQDATINGQANPSTGASTSYWSVQWFGSIYLKLSAGDYTFSITNTGSTALRAWIGKTQLGDELVNEWTYLGSAGTHTFTVGAAALSGSLPYGGGTVARDGWYPLLIEYVAAGGGSTAPVFKLTSSPAGYVDPGGTTIASGAQSTVVPSTSLSPLGCVDQRYQGTSHFDLVQKTCQAYGYQASVEPQSLESGLFPGVLAPRIREGADSDAILEPDDSQRVADGLVDYGNTLDATDFCDSIQGNGAGLQNGTIGQLQAYVYDHGTMAASLFDVQGWTDFSDASFPALLHALLNSQLGLRLAPWQLVAASPIGRPRQVYTWPLPGALGQLRWRPGDGIRVKAADVNVYDSVPRQLLLVTRQILPNGSAGVQVGLAAGPAGAFNTSPARPRTAEHSLRQALGQATRWSRNYQRQLVSLPGDFQDQVLLPVGGMTDANMSAVTLHPGDQVVRVQLRLNYTIAALGVVINGTDYTTLLSGPWTVSPALIDVTGYASPDTLNRVIVQLVNKDSIPSQVGWQLFVDVIR